jgi:hypothetical protein
VGLCASSWAGGIFHRCQERRYGIGDGIRGAPGQLMTCAWHELQASVWQSAGEPAAGIDGNQGVLRVGEQEHRRLDGRDGVLQLAQFAQQGALLGQERAPERGVLVAAWPQTCQLTCSSGRGGRPRRQAIWASRARAIHGVSRHATSAHSGPTKRCG